MKRKESLDKLLQALFLFSVILIGWGPIEIPTGTASKAVIRGCTWEAYFPLFFFYLLCRLYNRDLAFPRLWRDPFFLFGILAMLSFFWNPLRDSSLFFDLYLPALLAFYIFRYLLSKDFPGTSSLFWPCYIGALALMIVRGVIMKPAFLQHLSFFDTPYLHHNHVAMNMVIGIPPAMAFLIRDPKRKWLYLGLLIIMLAGLAFSNSRSGWISFGFVLLYLLWKSNSRMIRRAMLISILLFAILVGLFSFSRNRLMTLTNPLGDTSMQCRINMWIISGHIFRDYPLLGIGFSNGIFTSRENAYAAQLFIKRVIKVPGMFDPHPHNLYLQILVSLGIAGYLLFIWMIWDIWKALHSLGGEADADHSLLTAVKASLIGFAVGNMADTVFNSPQSTLIIFILLAYLFEWERFNSTGGRITAPEGAGSAVPAVAATTAPAGVETVSACDAASAEGSPSEDGKPPASEGGAERLS